MNDLRINRNLARWISLGLGIAGLVVTIIAVLAAPGNRLSTASYISLAVGILGLAGFVLLDPQALMVAITGRTGQHAITTWLMSVAFVALVVILFVILRKAEIKPLDLTEGKEYQLHEETIELLEALDADVEVIAFYNAQQTSLKEEVEIWLSEYKRYSNGRLTYRFVDPDVNPLEAQQLGGRQGVIIFKQGDRTAEANFANESTLTAALYRVQLGEPRKLYYIVGHGERSPDDFTGLGLSQLNSFLVRANYEVAPLNLFQEGGVPDDADLVLIAGPTAQFSPADVDALDSYLSDGGKAFILLDPGTGGGSLGNGVLGVSYNSDGSRIATAGADGTAKIWDAVTGEELVTLRGHSSDVMDVYFSPDDKQIATAGADGTVRVWDAKDGDQLYQLTGQTDGVRRLAYSPDGKLLVSVGEDNVVNVWDTSTYEPLSYSPLVALSPLLTVAFSPDSAVFAAGGARNTATGGVEGLIYVWDAATGEELTHQALHTDVVFDITFSSDGTTLYSTGIDGTLGTFDLDRNTGSTEALYTDLGISAFAIGPDGQGIYALRDGTIHVRSANATSGEDDEILTGHTDVIWSLRMSPDGIHFVTSSRDGDARVWNLDTLTNTLTISGHSAVDPLITYLGDSWGILVNDDLVIDQTSSIPQVPIIFGYATGSPITQSLSESDAQLVMPLARSVETADTPPAGMTLVPLMFSSSLPGQVTSWAESNADAPSVQYNEGEDTPGPVNLAVSGENLVLGGRVVVVGDADFVSNDALANTAYRNDDFFLNAANWLVGEEFGGINPDITVRPEIERPLSQAELIIFAATGTCVLPLVGLVIGVVVWAVRRRRR